MNSNFENLFYGLWQKIVDYLPNLIGGLILLIIGWVLGWIIKRVVIQILVILRFDRLLSKFRFSFSLSKADVRYAVYNFIGNIIFLIVFLIFLNSALVAMNLLVISKVIEQGVLFIPRLIVASVIFLIGWIISARVSKSVMHALLKESLPRATLISRFVKFVFILFFSALALTELDIAREVVMIGFATILICLCSIAVIIVYSNKLSLGNFFKGEKEIK
jgi:hypothetical protein